jgi:hypothetical protein
LGRERSGVGNMLQNPAVRRRCSAIGRKGDNEDKGGDRTDDLNVQRGPVRCERSRRQRVVTDRTSSGHVPFAREEKRKRASPLTVEALECEGPSVKPPVDMPLQGAAQYLTDIRTLPFQITVSEYFWKQRDTLSCRANYIMYLTIPSAPTTALHTIRGSRTLTYSSIHTRGP